MNYKCIYNNTYLRFADTEDNFWGLMIVFFMICFTLMLVYGALKVKKSTFCKTTCKINRFLIL